MAARVEHVAARIVERQAQAKAQALLHFGYALFDFFRRQQIEPPELIVGTEVSPGRAFRSFFPAVLVK
jgi:hypothetical protein